MGNTDPAAQFNYNYNNNGSSNSISSSKPVNINIQINPSGSGKPIILDYKFAISNLKSIIANTETLTCTLNGKLTGTNAAPGATTPSAAGLTSIVTLAKTEGVDDEWSALNLGGYDSYDYIVLNIVSANLTCWDGSAAQTLTINFYDDTYPGQEFTDNFSLVYDDVMSIVDFTCVNPVLQGSVAIATFNWQIKGSYDSYKLFDGNKTTPIASFPSNPPQSGETPQHTFSYPLPAIGDYSFTLLAEKNIGKPGYTALSKTLPVRYFQTATCYRLDIGNTIGNICAANDGNMIFGTFFSTAASNGPNKRNINAIGYSSVGVNDWKQISLTDDDVAWLAPFTFSPIIHIKNAGEVYGKLLFIGGSKIDPMQCGNSVAIVDLEKLPDQQSDRVKIINSNIPWASRMGHACVQFPVGAEDKIWLIGGQDEYGQALNDVWVSGDGISWDNLNQAGNVNNDTSNPVAMNWAARCLFGAAVQLTMTGNQKNELWIGGGFSECGGAETTDMWVWDKQNWFQVCYGNDATDYYQKPYLSSAIAFIGKENTDSTGMYTIGCHIDKNDNLKPTIDFNKINGQNSPFIKAPLYDLSSGTVAQAIQSLTDQNMSFTTVYFRGYLWFLRFQDNGSDGIGISDVYYYVPNFNSPINIVL